ncbi:hypothetical protein, conserved [Angomonas deanei]|uniref:Uncharacterized protein n=1 Tax=Angomonas deanei TaxID=59799 RepID=A0A7G2C448_9TRYP|nr:hypothetical protein, conserved [Angomonas deanei]
MGLVQLADILLHNLTHHTTTTVGADQSSEGVFRLIDQVALVALHNTIGALAAWAPAHKAVREQQVQLTAGGRVVQRTVVGAHLLPGGDVAFGEHDEKSTLGEQFERVGVAGVVEEGEDGKQPYAHVVNLKGVEVVFENNEPDVVFCQIFEGEDTFRRWFVVHGVGSRLCLFLLFGKLLSEVEKLIVHRGGEGLPHDVYKAVLHGEVFVGEKTVNVVPSEVLPLVHKGEKEGRHEFGILLNEAALHQQDFSFFDIPSGHKATSFLIILVYALQSDRAVKGVFILPMFYLFRFPFDELTHLLRGREEGILFLNLVVEQGELFFHRERVFPVFPILPKVRQEFHTQLFCLLKNVQLH